MVEFYQFQVHQTWTLKLDGPEFDSHFSHFQPTCFNPRTLIFLIYKMVMVTTS